MSKLEQRMSSKPIPVIERTVGTGVLSCGNTTGCIRSGYGRNARRAKAAAERNDECRAAHNPAGGSVRAATSRAVTQLRSASALQQPGIRETRAPETRTTEELPKRAETEGREVDVKREAKREDRRKASVASNGPNGAATGRTRSCATSSRRSGKRPSRPAFAAQPVRMETPRMQLFGADD